MAEDDSRVGERRITSTETVTGWARIGSSARRAYRDAPSFIYACDAAAQIAGNALPNYATAFLLIRIVWYRNNAASGQI